MKIIDTKGHLCPEPLIMARNGLQKVAEGETVQIISDNETSWQNLMSFLSDLGANPVSKLEDGVYYVEATNPVKKSTTEAAIPEDYCKIPVPVETHKSYVVAVRSREMGEGDNELGGLLVRGYFNALKNMESIPTHILMYNSGIFHSLKGTDVAESLAQLEDLGVSVIVCGTCVDFYQVKEKVAVGRISNMYQIATILAEAGHVVYL
jgi:selenium metabolism protein YedF